MGNWGEGEEKHVLYILAISLLRITNDYPDSFWKTLLINLFVFILVLRNMEILLSFWKTEGGTSLPPQVVMMCTFILTPLSLF